MSNYILLFPDLELSHLPQRTPSMPLPLFPTPVWAPFLALVGTQRHLHGHPQHHCPVLAFLWAQSGLPAPLLGASVYTHAPHTWGRELVKMQVLTQCIGGRLYNPAFPTGLCVMPTDHTARPHTWAHAKAFSVAPQTPRAPRVSYFKTISYASTRPSSLISPCRLKHSSGEQMNKITLLRNKCWYTELTRLPHAPRGSPGAVCVNL